MFLSSVYAVVHINLMMNVISPFASCTILVDWGNSVCDCSGFNLEWMPVASAGFLCLFVMELEEYNLSLRK